MNLSDIAVGEQDELAWTELLYTWVCNLYGYNS